MSDLVVTVPKDRWADWIAEGDLPGNPDSGEEWGFYTFGARPGIILGERVYIVAHGKLRGYAPLTRFEFHGDRVINRVYHGHVVLGRKGGAVAVTVAKPIIGFRGWRYRDWDRADEIPFPDWRTP